MAQSSRSPASELIPRSGSEKWPCVHPVEDPRDLGGAGAGHPWVDFHAQSPAESPRRSLLLHKSERHQAGPAPQSCCNADPSDPTKGR